MKLNCKRSTQDDKTVGGRWGGSGWMYGYYLAGSFRKISRYFPTWEQVRRDLQKWRWSLRFSSLDHRESLQFVAVVVINGSVGERSNAQRVKQPMTCVWRLEEFYKCLRRLTALKWASTHRRTQTARFTQHGTNCKKQRRATLIVLVWLQHKFKTGHVHKKVDDKKIQIINFLTKTPKPCFVPLLSTWLAAYKVNKSLTCLLWEEIGIRMPTSSEGQKKQPKEIDTVESDRGGTVGWWIYMK